jgi:hypothetical protein
MGCRLALIYRTAVAGSPAERCGSADGLWRIERPPEEISAPEKIGNAFQESGRLGAFDNVTVAEQRGMNQVSAR